MKELNKKEMLNIDGGTSFSASMLSSIYKAIDTIFSIGEALGSYIRRVSENKMCGL